MCKRIIPALYWPRYYSLPKAFTMIYIFNSGLWLWSNKQNGKQQSCGAWNMLQVFCKMYDVLSNILWNGKQSPRGYAFLLVLRCVLNVSEILTNCIESYIRYKRTLYTYIHITINIQNIPNFTKVLIIRQGISKNVIMMMKPTSWHYGFLHYIISHLL